MRKHIRILLALGVCLAFILSGHLPLAAFTWEGELNPNEFDSWKLLSIQPTSQGYFWVIIENPDRGSPIDVVALRVDSNSNVLGYRYFKDGEPYLYIFDSNEDKYVRYYFTQEDKESCMKCHSGGIQHYIAGFEKFNTADTADKLEDLARQIREA